MAAMPDLHGSANEQDASLAPEVTPAPEVAAKPVLELVGLGMRFTRTAGLRGRIVKDVRAVDGVDLAIRHGEALGLVGESGCGKSTLGRCVVRAHNPTEGRMLYRSADGLVQDAVGLRRGALKTYQGEVRMVFQDPFSSLNPRMTLLQIVAEPLLMHGMRSRTEREEKVAGLLERVGLRTEHMHRYPHAFSGGQRQRVSIARALALDPRLLVADEAVSALDVSVRAQILNLLLDLQEEEQLTYLLITHDLSVVDHLCHRVAVMYLGRLVELGSTSEVQTRPLHPYAASLLAAVPVADPRLRPQRSAPARGELPDPANRPSGCAFRTRCEFATQRCTDEVPTLREVEPGRQVACHHAEDLELNGIPT